MDQNIVYQRRFCPINGRIRCVPNDIEPPCSQTEQGITIYELDVYSFFEEISGDPDAYGFTNVTQASPNFTVDNIFTNTAGYLFWDDIHPTTEGHAELAEKAYEILTSVHPEMAKPIVALANICVARTI